MTSKDNPYFAKSYVNRLWGYLFGVGIIEPLDDIRAGNPATNPELLDYLTDEFIKSNFDVPTHHADDLQVADVSAIGSDEQVERRRQGRTMRTRLARRLPAEVLLDTVYRATGSVSKFPGVRAGNPRGRIARFGRRASQRIPDDIWTAGPRKRLRMRANQRLATWTGHGLGQRSDARRCDRRPGQ